MIRRPPRSTLDRSSAASDVYKRQAEYGALDLFEVSDSASLTHNPARMMALHDVKLADMQINLEKAQMKPEFKIGYFIQSLTCLLYTSPSPRDRTRSRMPSSA